MAPLWPSRPARPNLSLTDSGLVISWAAVLEAEHYTVQVFDGAEEMTFDWETQQLLHSDGGLAVPGNRTEVLVRSLFAGRSYKARVTAKKHSSWGSSSAYSSPLRTPAVQAPPRPTVQMPRESSVRIEWSAVPGADRYTVIVHDGRGEKQYDWRASRLLAANEGSGQCVPSTETCVTLRATAGRTYKAKVVAGQGALWGPFSNYSAACEWPPATEAIVQDVSVSSGGSPASQPSATSFASIGSSWWRSVTASGSQWMGRMSTKSMPTARRKATARPSSDSSETVSI